MEVEKTKCIDFWGIAQSYERSLKNSMIMNEEGCKLILIAEIANKQWGDPDFELPPDHADKAIFDIQGRATSFLLTNIFS